MDQNKNGQIIDRFTVWFLADGLGIGDKLGYLTLPDMDGKPVRYAMRFAMDNRVHCIEFEGRVQEPAVKLHRGLFQPEDVAPGIKALWDMEEAELFDTVDVPYARIRLEIARTGDIPWEPEFTVPVDRPVHTAVPCLVTECYPKDSVKLEKCLVWYGDAITVTGKESGFHCAVSELPDVLGTKMVIRRDYVSGQPCLTVNMRHPYSLDVTGKKAPLTDRERAMARSAMDVVLGILEAEDAYIWCLSRMLPEGDADAQAAAKLRRNWKFLGDAWAILETLVPAHTLENGMLASALWQDRDPSAAMEAIDAYLAS